MKEFVKRHRILTAVAAVTLLLLLALLGVFYAGARYYQTHFFPGTVLSGVNVSKLTAEEATDKVESFVSDYLLTITCREDQTYQITGPSIGYAYVPNGEIEMLLDAQDEYDWIHQQKTKKETDITLDTTFDESLLKEELSSLPFMQTQNMVTPEDAKIEWVEDGYELVPEVMGTLLEFDTVFSHIKQAVTEGRTTTDVLDLYENPTIYSTDAKLNACMDTIEKYFGSSITYTFGKQEPFELTNEVIQSWLTVEDDYTVSVDDEKVTNFVQSMASTYNTYGDVREFKTTFGDKLKIGGGDYGWIINKAKEKEQIYEDLASGGHIEREPVYEQTAKRHGTNDIGTTYVEIDYTNQHLWYYEDGELMLDTDIVSGNLNRKNGSPDGLFKIVYKQQNATLVGEGYSSPVNYFMPFAYNVGIHDASWRSSFGDEIYLRNGSHGCINVPKEAAEKLYGMLDVGTPVIAYYREAVSLTAENARISNAYSYVSEEKLKNNR